MSTFIQFIEAIKVYYHVKSHHSLTSCFQVIGNSPIEKYEQSSHNQSYGQKSKMSNHF